MIRSIFRIDYGAHSVRRNPLIIGSAIAAGGALLSSLLNNSSQRSFNKEQIRYQNELLDKRYAREDRINANSALIQRQGMERAGLSPVMSDYGTLSTNTDASVPSGMQAPQYDVGALAQIAQMAQQQQLVDAQVQNIKADTNKKVAETANTEMDTVLKNTQNWQMRELTPAQKDNLIQQSNLFKQEAEKSRVSVPFVQKQIEKCQSEIANLDVQTSWLLDSYDNRLAQSAMQVAVLQSQGSLNVAQAAVAYKSLQVMDKQMRLIESEISLNSEQWLKLNQEVNNLAIDGDYKQFQLNVEKQFGKEKARLILEQINENIINTRSEMMWRPVGMLIGGVGAGAAAARVLK